MKLIDTNYDNLHPYINQFNFEKTINRIKEVVKEVFECFEIKIEDL